MATMKDVAQLAGVSTATVSRALMNPEKVSASTRKKVEQAVMESGYSPNSLARNLRRNESKTIVTIVPDICDPISASLFEVSKKPQWNMVIWFYWVIAVNKKTARIHSSILSLPSKQTACYYWAPICRLMSASLNRKNLPPLVMACEYSPEL